MNKAEERLQMVVSRYISIKYPDVIFTSDGSGLKLPMGLAKKSKAMRCAKYKLPDMIILHPSNGYHGLCMELKNSINDVFKKDGNLRETDHIQQQAKTIARLNAIGYKALFVCGIDHAIKAVDGYMG